MRELTVEQERVRRRRESEPVSTGEAHAPATPGVLTAANVLALQRSAGNHALARQLARPTSHATGGRRLQRVIWAVDQDHLMAVKQLAEQSKRFWRDEEISGPMGNTGLAEDSADSITLWGHTHDGGATFGRMTPKQLVDELLRFGLERSKHTTLNIIACAPNATQSAHVRTYAQAVQRVLRTLKPPLGREIQVRTLPMVKEGSESTLWRNQRTNMTAYVTYPAGKGDDVSLILKLYNAEWDKCISKLRERGYDVALVPFSGLIASLAPVVEVQEFKGNKRTDMNELLIPNVYGAQ